jgi:peptidoglycan/xylan/chitin deacetylase (PgdA/CDA1 family)
MRSAVAASCLLASLCGIASAVAAECPGNPNALGVSRTIVVDPAEHPRLGTMQYEESLPLNDHEVVLTFDDGPLPPYTSRILDILGSECVKATFFIVGRMALGYPPLVRRAYSEGHTIANHSQNHPFTFHRMAVDQAAREIEDGFTSLRTVLGDPNAVSPFFRIPGLLRQDSVERYLAQRQLVTWSLDFLADDWTHISANEVVRRALNRIEARGRGILLLHDIQPATALGLPTLLKELKARGYKIVHVMPATPDRPKTATDPQAWVQRHPSPGIWPRVVMTGADMVGPTLEVPGLQSFGAASRAGATVPVTLAPDLTQPQLGPDDLPIPPVSLWPRNMTYSVPPDIESLPVPAAQHFRYSRFYKPTTFAARKAAGKKAPAKVAATTAVKTVRGKTQAPPRDLNPASKTRPIGHQLTVPRPTADHPTPPAPLTVGTR